MIARVWRCGTRSRNRSDIDLAQRRSSQRNPMPHTSQFWELAAKCLGQAAVPGLDALGGGCRLRPARIGPLREVLKVAHARGERLFQAGPSGTLTPVHAPPSQRLSHLAVDRGSTWPRARRPSREAGGFFRVGDAGWSASPSWRHYAVGPSLMMKEDVCCGDGA